LAAPFTGGDRGAELSELYRARFSYEDRAKRVKRNATATAINRFRGRSASGDDDLEPLGRPDRPFRNLTG
jgi:hypothetical protein